MKICVYGAASSKINEVFIKTGEELGRELVNHNHSLVFGGGRNGMMGAVARGVKENNGSILGISPDYFEESNAEISFIGCTEFIKTKTMRERKKLLDENSDAFIITPGGVGTFDEFFEILTLKQLGRHNKPIVIFNIDNYYKSLLEMIHMSVEKNFIPQECTKLYKITSTIQETLDYIENYDPSDIDISCVKIR